MGAYQVSSSFQGPLLIQTTYYKNAAKPSTAAPTAPTPWTASLSPAAGEEVAGAAPPLAVPAVDALVPVVADEEPESVVEAVPEPEVVLAVAAVPAPLPIVVEFEEQPADAGYFAGRKC